MLLAENIGILAICSICVAAFIGPIYTRSQLGLRPVLFGAALGGVSVIVMQAPVTTTVGAIFDTRAGPIVAAAYFGGPLAGAAAAALAAAGRFLAGGPFVLGAVGGIAVYVLVGLAARRLMGAARGWAPSVPEWVGLAVVTTVLLVPMFFVAVDPRVGLAALRAHWLTLLASNVLSFLIVCPLLGQLLALRVHTQAIMASIAASRAARLAAPRAAARDADRTPDSPA